MSYTAWFEEQASKHKAVMKRLLAQGLERDEIIAYFDFENMVKNEPGFCPLYKELNAQGEMGKKCHDMESLNCYLCACPNFRFSDRGVEEREGNTVYSFCAIDSKDGQQALYGDKIHQDCSRCSVPHHVTYVKKNFDEDWKSIMKACPL